MILCGGAINTPQLLMLSGIGPADHLREFDIGVLQHLPGVGQNLQVSLKLESRRGGDTGQQIEDSVAARRREKNDLIVNPFL